MSEQTISPAGFQLPGVRLPFEPYSGPECLCDRIQDSGPRNRFDWPSRCFECRCGSRFWCSRPSEGYWDRVTDSNTWTMLKRSWRIPEGSIVHLEEAVWHIDSVIGRHRDTEYQLHREDGESSREDI